MGLFDRNRDEPRQRTAEERERARAERAARRAAREGLSPEEAGLPPVEIPPPAEAAAAPPPRQPEPAPSRPRQPASAPTPPRQPAPAEATAAAPSREPVAEPAAPPPPQRQPVKAARSVVDSPSVVLDEAPVDDWSALDEPARAPRRRLGGRFRTRRDGSGPEPPQGGGGAPAPPGRRRRWPAVLGLLGLAVVAVAVWFLVSIFQPFHGDGGRQVAVTIPRGAGMSRAADVLANRGVISSAFFFKLRAKLDGTSDIKSGTYLLRTDASYGSVLTALEKGPPPAKATNVTITEGHTRREVDRLLRRTSLQGSYLSATLRSPLLRPQQYGAPRGVQSLEGFLFPATYQVAIGAPVRALVDKQVQTFKQRFRTVNLAYARSKHLTPYDVLTIASMIEREAALDRERPLVAAVIYNRLKQGIPLGIDATIRYAVNNFDRPLTLSQLAIDSPYNTRKHQGLPPTPIDNPGLKSIQAAAHPAHVGYLYYVVKPGACNEHAFSSTAAQFAQDQARYNSARAAKGGNSPTTCR